MTSVMSSAAQRSSAGTVSWRPAKRVLTWEGAEFQTGWNTQMEQNNTKIIIKKYKIWCNSVWNELSLKNSSFWCVSQFLVSLPKAGQRCDVETQLQTSKERKQTGPARSSCHFPYSPVQNHCSLLAVCWEIGANLHGNIVYKAKTPFVHF